MLLATSECRLTPPCQRRDAFKGGTEENQRFGVPAMVAGPRGRYKAARYKLGGSKNLHGIDSPVKPMPAGAATSSKLSQSHHWTPNDTPKSALQERCVLMTEKLAVFDGQHRVGSSYTHLRPAPAGSSLPKLPDWGTFPVRPGGIGGMSVEFEILYERPTIYSKVGRQDGKLPARLSPR